jgi:hypothetical protein
MAGLLLSGRFQQPEADWGEHVTDDEYHGR